MRHVVTVTNQRRAIGADRWITEGLRIYGPFYTSHTAQDFARRVASGVIRVRFTMALGVRPPQWEGGVWTLDDYNRRTVIAASAIQPSSTRTAWKFIRDWFGDKPITTSRVRKEQRA